MSNDIVPIVGALEQVCGVTGLSLQLDVPAKLELDNVYLQMSPCDDIQLDVDDDWNYDKLLEKCKELLIHHRNGDDVLLRGYKVAKDNSVASNIYTSSSNVSNTFIRSFPWRMLHSIIGNSLMAYIFVNHNGFLKTGSEFVHLFGKGADEYLHKKFKTFHLFTLTPSLYKKHSQIKKFNPVPSSKKELIQKIFSQQLDSLTSYQKFESKIKLFSKLITLLIKSHQEFSYFKCFDEICRERAFDGNNMSLAISKKEVIRFCSVVFDSIFPRDMYGCSHNKSVIIQKLSILVLGEKGFGLELLDLMNNLKLKEVKWLGKDYHGKWNKQDHDMRYRRFASFIAWIFSNFFPHLLASFFHITHISSSKELLYFRHSSWSRISSVFVEKYKVENLKEDPFIDTDNISKSTDLYCQFRVMPKKNNEFRVINIPLRGKSPKNQMDYMAYIKKEVRPTRQILSQLRHLKKSKFPRVNSVSDIPLELGKFKRKLRFEHGSIPLLYFVKFDVKECYDNLPKQKIRESVSSLISPNEVYFMKSERKLNLISETFKNFKRLKTMDEVTNGSNGNIEVSSLHLGGDFTFSLSGNEIKSIVDSQIDHTYTLLNNRTYERTKGVFQGLHLSGLFCDLVYDRFIDEKFGFLQNDDSLVLRLADDFLVISSNKSLVLDTRKLIDDGFDDYGIKVNKLKTSLNFSSGGDYNGVENQVFSFCGFEISISNLSILKDHDTLKLSYFRSHKELTRKILWILKSRLSNNTLKLTDTNNASTVLKQIFILASSSAKLYQRGLTAVKPSLHLFSLFFNQTIEEIENQLNGKKTDNFILQEAKFIIIQAFLLIFEEKNTKLQELIQFLEKMLV